MGKNNINLCITTNIDYLKYTASFIESLIDHLNINYIYNLYILTDKKISRVEKSKLICHKNNNLNIICKSFSHEIFNGYEEITVKELGKVKGNYTYFYRWFIDKYVKEDKIIYFDTDMIINGDISELYNIDLGNKIFGAVKDIFFLNSELISKYKITNFFNSGMLLINLKKWKENDLGKRCLRFKKEHINETILFDQDTLNIVGKDDWISLSPKWNSMIVERFQYKDVQYSKNEFLQSKNPKIIHFTGFFHRPRKGTFCLHQYCFLYFKYLRRTKYREKKDTLMFFQRCITSNCIIRYIIKLIFYLGFKMKSVLKFLFGNHVFNVINKIAFK